jgi:hypothetical protein
MTEFYQFASDHPFLTFFLGVLVAEVLIKTPYYIAKAISETVRK